MIQESMPKFNASMAMAASMLTQEEYGKKQKKRKKTKKHFKGRLE